MSLYAIIIMKHMGADKFKGSLGWANMCHGVTMAAFFPLTGKISSYFVCVCVCVCVCFLLLFFFFCFFFFFLLIFFQYLKSLTIIT